MGLFRDGGLESPCLKYSLADCTRGHPAAQDTAASVSSASFRRKNWTIKLAAGSGTGREWGWGLVHFNAFSYLFFLNAVAVISKVTSG